MSINPRVLAAKSLIKILEKNAHADEVLNETLKRHNLKANDRALLTELVYGTTRQKLKLDFIISSLADMPFNKISPEVKNILRLGLYQLIEMRIPEYASVNSCVELTKPLRVAKSGSFINAILRNYIRKQNSIIYPDKNTNAVEYLSVIHSHPQWLVEKWLNNFEFDNTEKLLKFNNTPAPLTIQINTLKSSLQNVMDLFNNRDIKFTLSSLVPDCLNLQNAGKVYELPGFNEGFWFVQSELSALVARVTDPQENQTVIDFCAAPGSKTIAMAIKMANTGKIFAVDISANRLTKLKENCYRMGITNIEVLNADATNLIDQALPYSDRILIDAPCSNTGVFNKRADARWQKSPEDMVLLPELQQKILNNALNFMKPQSKLIYSVCSIEPEEGINIISDLLTRHPDFVPENIEKFIPPEFKMLTDEGFMYSLPFKSLKEGFFAGCVKKS